jgi:flagellar basal-body rod protein FlgF
VENSGYIALSRMIAQQRLLDVRASNLANVSTPGFKAERLMFSDYVLRQNGIDTAPGDSSVQMVQDRATYRDWGEGDISRTGNPLDLALQGEGFFAVETSRGERYTRAGRFTISATNQIVDLAGNVVSDTNGQPLNVPEGGGEISIKGDGTVTVGGNQVGQLKVVTFDDNQQLQAEGGTLFTTTQTARPATTPQVLQGAVEASNTQAITEMTKMMAEMQEFKFASQFVDGEDQREQSAIDKIGKKAAS